MPEQMEMLTESPEEKSFFDNKGAAPAVAPESAPVAEPTPEPAAAPEPAPAPAAAEPPQKTMIPLATLLEERRSMQAKIDALAAKITPPAPAAPPADPDQDPITVIKDLVDFKQQTVKERAEQAELAAITDFGARHAAEFRKDHPDFDQAYNHIRTARANQLIEQGQVSTPQELNQRIYGEEREIITMAAKMGVSPAALMYNFALSAGYTPQQAAAVAAAPTQPAAAQPAPVTPAAPSVPDKLKMAAAGQDRAGPSGKAPAAGGGGPMDLRHMSQLSDAEFDKATEGNNWRGLWN